MPEHEDSTKSDNTGMVLPESLISSIDLSRVLRELTTLDGLLYQENVRAPKQPANLARSSQILEDLASANSVSLAEASQRGELLAALKALEDKSPHIHMSFAVETSAKFNKRMIIWLRENIHPLVLLEIGLQPLLAIGCVVRTDNKIFDMSLRHRFKEQRHILREKIGGLNEAAASTVTKTPTASSTPIASTAEVPAA